MRSVWALLAVAGCSEPPLDPTRSIPDRGTLGEEIFRLFHQDFERESPRRAEGFMLARDGFVDSIDHLFPPNELAHTQEFLVELLPLYDDETLPGLTDRLAGMFERLALDPSALDSLSALMHRNGYIELAHEEALIRKIAASPKYRDLIKATIDLMLAHDGLDSQGNLDPSESDAIRRLQIAVSEDLRDPELSDDDQRDIVLLVDLLLSEDPRLSRGLAAPSIVARDARGMAKVRISLGSLPPPFVDADGDGLADIDSRARFVDASGQPIDVPPFGAGGRAVASGEPLFEYVDLERTILAGLLRDGLTLGDRDVPMKAIRSVDAILGDRTPEGAYSVENPIHDVLYAVEQTANLRELPDVIQLVQVLLEDHEATTGWVLLETGDQLDVADRHTVALQPGSTFFNDLMGWIRRVLREDGLAEAILDALEDTVFDDLEEATVRMMRHRRDLVTEGDVANGTIFTVPVNRADPDVRGNQSLQQRLLHLMFDTRGAEYQPELIGIPLGFIFKIEDLAEFYLLSVIGQSEVPALVSTLTGLSQRPTPEELAVFLNRDQTFGNPVGHEGVEVRWNDGDTLFAATESGLIDVLRPLIQIFHDRGQLRLIFELFEILHLHWASLEGRDYQSADAGAPRYSKLSGIARYEPLLIETFEETRVLDSVRTLLVQTKPVRLASGRPGRDVLLALVRKILTKDGDLRNRAGDRDVILRGERITPLSPFDLLRASFSDLDRVVKRDPVLDREWSEVKEALGDVFADLERTGPESGALTNRRAVPILLTALSFAEDRARLRPNDAALSAWITGEALTPMKRALVSKELPAIIDVLYAIEADGRFTAATQDLVDDLTDEQRGFGDLLVLLGDGLEATKDASIAAGFLRFLGRELDPSSDLLFQGATLTTRSLELDEEEFMLEVIRRGIEVKAEGGLYVYGVTGAVRQANRTNPIDVGLMSAEDIRRISVAVAEYLVDDRHGMEKFYTLVKNRKIENREVPR